jgi:hypothetical protein
MAAHLNDNGDAHSLQNFTPSRLSLPHLAHHVFPLGEEQGLLSISDILKPAS